ncbi:glycosyltransferase family 9 protein [Pseudaeromonas paramecii]|uniref:Glycosyltransferase family 9 protein n=1 Tax=Pseudaeromonas paramecii TaxID=2138166 RepID=A0ABP8PXB2_9GAMM
MQRLLVIRNDKIGDFMLAWPSFAMLKASQDCHVTALVPAYTAELARLCPWIDEVILDPGKQADSAQQQALLATIKAARFDAAISLFSTGRVAWSLWRAGIPYRLAPATKWAQLLYNHRVRQRRSRSAKPEYQYNLDLIRHYLREQGLTPVEPQPPYLRFDAATLARVRAETAAALGIPAQQPWLMVHAGSGGSANNLSLDQYARLILGLQAVGSAPCVLTAGPGEEAKAAQLQALVQRQGGQAVIYHSVDGLTRFCQVLACADLFLAGSTGPLHICSALDVPTVGFFPMRRSATPLRWRPLNSEGRHLSFTPPQAGEEDMSRVDIDAAIAQILPWWQGWQTH